MYRGSKIGLVIIAYNEQRLIEPTLDNVPDFVDTVIVVDDCSTDNTRQVIEDKKAKDPRINIIKHKENIGPGGAIISGYLKSSELGNMATVVIGGDNQMDQTEMNRLLDPIIDGEADYTKGNRFLVDAFGVMPFKRLIGNIALSILTSTCAGTFHVFDTQDGYTAISKEAIDMIDWSQACQAYGYVTDFVIRIAAYGLKIKDVPRRSIYLSGERQSQIVIGTYIKRFFPILFNALKWKMNFRLNKN